MFQGSDLGIGKMMFTIFILGGIFAMFVWNIIAWLFAHVRISFV